MREVWPRFKVDIFLDPGFPYPGELAYGYRNGLIDVQFLAKVIDGLARNGVTLVPEELEMTSLLSDEVDQIRDLAFRLSRYERDDSGEVWQYYFTIVAANEIRDPVEKFETLDSVWSYLGYPDGMTRIIYPQEGLPAHLYPLLGERALSDFLAGWSDALTQRDPSVLSR
ncbi:hypothetical protein [Streptomyces salyersiae]|uniref:Uncharacterized protein n=1 Tax=Streptomyces salyersiae TaxID=3075530 RepID=A0ABU2RNB6_9ACTN|nr:hypothetical protein [Streptomyces sp. DSM 41770]MDT0430315.1 hypothetical protein [Streptomyces sp. DSM 41770]